MVAEVSLSLESNSFRKREKGPLDILFESEKKKKKVSYPFDINANDYESGLTHLFLVLKYLMKFC